MIQNLYFAALNTLIFHYSCKLKPITSRLHYIKDRNNFVIMGRKEVRKSNKMVKFINKLSDFVRLFIEITSL